MKIQWWGVNWKLCYIGVGRVSLRLYEHSKWHRCYEDATVVSQPSLHLKALSHGNYWTTKWHNSDAVSIEHEALNSDRQKKDLLTTFIYLLQFVHRGQGEKLVSRFGANSQGPAEITHNNSIEQTHHHVTAAVHTAGCSVTGHRWTQQTDVTHPVRSTLKGKPLQRHRTVANRRLARVHQKGRIITRTSSVRTYTKNNNNSHYGHNEKNIRDTKPKCLLWLKLASDHSITLAQRS